MLNAELVRFHRMISGERRRRGGKSLRPRPSATAQQQQSRRLELSKKKEKKIANVQKMWISLFILDSLIYANITHETWTCGKENREDDEKFTSETSDEISKSSYEENRAICYFPLFCVSWLQKKNQPASPRAAFASSSHSPPQVPTTHENWIFSLVSNIWWGWMRLALNSVNYPTLHSSLAQ